jgi:ACT domain-containing protein
MDTCHHPKHDRRHCFVVEAVEAPDTLVRVLTPFAVQGARLASVVLDRVQHAVSIRIEADGLDAERAETLVRRLRGLPSVVAVAVGWRSTAAAAG